MGEISLTSSQLTERYSLPVKVKETLTVQEIIHTQAGEIVLDMGQNMVGFVEFDSNLPAGTKVILDFGEVLQQGNFYNDNYRTAKARYEYISDGRREKGTPSFHLLWLPLCACDWMAWGSRTVCISRMCGVFRSGDNHIF